MSETNKEVIWDVRFSSVGSLKIIPLSPQTKLLPQLAAGFLIHSWPNGRWFEPSWAHLQNHRVTTSKIVTRFLCARFWMISAFKS